MGDYIDVSDIETYLGTTFSSSTSPTDTQMTDFLAKGEADFETEVGVFTEQTVTDEIVDGHFFGIKVANLPILSITSIEERSGTIFDPTYTTVDSADYLITNANIGKVELANPISGDRMYRVSYTSGYAKASMPEGIKTLVMLYTLKHAFRFTFLETYGDLGGRTETIDVQVYREVTNGGSPFNGLTAIEQVISDQKSKVLGSLKTFAV